MSDKEIVAMPPNATDLEEVVLGAILIDKRAIKEVYHFLKPEMFYIDAHKIIYKTMVEMYEQHKPLDLLTVSEQLRKKEKLKYIGGDFYLINLTQRVSSSAHIEYHSRIIAQKYVLREFIRISNYMLSHSYHSDPDIFDMIDYNRKHLDRLESFIGVDSVTHLTAEEELKIKVNNYMMGLPSGIKSYIKTFDEKTGGWQPRELITIAARPGMGKTTIVISNTHKLSIKNNIPSLFFSLEMSDADIYQRYSSIETGIDFSLIKQGKLNAKQYAEVIDSITNIRSKPIYVFNEKMYYSIVNTIRKYVKEFNVKIVFIDYIQLVQITENPVNETQELRAITRGLKSLALELNIPIIQLSQLDRSLDTRSNKRPTLSDLKMSGSIEEDSDTVVFPFREAYYNKKANFPKKEEGRTIFDIAKGRNIGTFEIDCFFDYKRFDFYDMEDYQD